MSIPSRSQQSTLLGFMLAPQLLLLLINGRAWGIVHGEMSPEQLRMALWIGLCEGLLLLGSTTVWGLLRWLKRPVNLVFCAGILLAGIGYLWLFTAYFERLMPSTVADWMLPGSQLLYYQYALVMPSLFYAGLRLACFPVRLGKAADIGASLATVITIPLGWYVGLRVLDGLWRGMEPEVWVILTLAVGSTVILLMAFLRMLTYAYLALVSVSWGWPLMLFIAGLLAPLGGLLLNRKIPFPYDFQSQSVYVLTCLNALALLLPFTPREGRNRLVWCLRCTTYPFTLYFFIVFLPFLPLSLLAMIAAGAGFLILAPTLLFIVHTRSLIEEARALAKTWGAARMLAALVACVALLPLALTTRALLDKQALTQALDIAYRPDYTDGEIRLNRTALKRTLHRLQDIKHGIYLPFITDAYDALVLDGMVLPDPKRQYLETLFFGKPFEFHASSSMFTDILNPASTRRRERNQNRVRLPPRNVQLINTETHALTAGDTTTATLVLTLQNDNDQSDSAEYVADITLPDGVFSTGYWLHIGDQRVPGRIIDKRAAMWVYHMIRDQTRRDPGMLVYTGEDTVRLSVFPFAAAETRTTEIAFSYPTGLSPQVQIGGRMLALPSGTMDEPAAFSHQDADSTTLVLPTATTLKLPCTRRQPYLHFIIDGSQQAAAAYPGFVAEAERLSALAASTQPDGASALGGLTLCRVTLANYGFRHLTTGLIPLGEAPGIITRHQGSLPFHGGFSPERAIKAALLEWREQPVLDARNIPLVPIFVVLKAADTAVLHDEDGIGPFADGFPEVSAYHVVRPDGTFDAHAFGREAPVPLAAIPPLPPVIPLRAGSAFAACLTGQPGIVQLGSTQAPEYYDANTGGYQPLPTGIPLAADSPIVQGLDLMEAWAETRYQPATAEGRRHKLLTRSRQHGILIPGTAYIVVENRAQWDMLDRAEKKSLKADSQLAFDEFIESPAPPLWLLAPIVLLLTLRRIRTTNTGDGNGKRDI